MLGNSKIMMDNGQYKSIATLQKGDKLRSFSGAPSTVSSVSKKRTSVSEELITLKHDGWYSTSSVSGEQEVLMFDTHVKKPLWIRASEADYFSDSYVLPRKSYDPDRQSNFHCSFELGFLVGAFLRIGGLHNFPEVSFVYNRQSNIEDLLKKYSSNLYKVTPVVRHMERGTKMSFMNKYMWNTFSNLGLYEDRTLPDMLLKSGHEFASGLNIGLVKSGFQGVPPIGPSIYEMLYWSSFNSEQLLCFGQKKVISENTRYDVCHGRVFLTNRGEYDMYEIELTDNNTFIANNFVMRVADM